MASGFKIEGSFKSMLLWKIDGEKDIMSRAFTKTFHHTTLAANLLG